MKWIPSGLSDPLVKVCITYDLFIFLPLFPGPLCRQADAVCEYGCRPGHYTPVCNATCQSQCIDDTCNITTGVCTECGRPNPGMMCPEGSKWQSELSPRLWSKAVLSNWTDISVVSTVLY